MILCSVDDSPILDLETVARALTPLFRDGSISGPRYVSSPDVEGTLDVDPSDGPSFSVELSRDHSGVSIDGLFEQNELVAAALRAAIPPAAPRIVVIEPARGTFAELPKGITASELAMSWQDVQEFDEKGPTRRSPAPE
ncbi:MAG: hypothetical protein FWE61_02545 [Micrococcales bacterium]|nr:hypothetical protein [Micrococcales bacterium]